ncbi:hypothetical protein [Nonlabens sp. Asnod2-A12]|uniref:hypothetical protein n=1 Tax=Nonlabens sp. Asnod2-A12 TaxID=3160578 RepID=UPI00386CA1CB
MKLLNTIEIEPLDYTENEYEFPNTSKEKNAKAWSDFWYKCVSDSNLESLKPIELGSYLIDIKNISDSELKTILQKELKGKDLSNAEEYVEPLFGGIVITENDKIIIEPTCCGDIANLNHWEKIEKFELNKWEQLWIGHPWVYCKKTNESIILSDYTEVNLGDYKELSEKYNFSRQELNSQIKSSRKDINAFEKQIRKVLVELEIENANKISKLLIGNK